jgi:hypothetical protein
MRLFRESSFCTTTVLSFCTKVLKKHSHERINVCLRCSIRFFVRFSKLNIHFHVRLFYVSLSNENGGKTERKPKKRVKNGETAGGRKIGAIISSLDNKNDALW